jgi:hypothetical protein
MPLERLSEDPFAKCCDNEEFRHGDVFGTATEGWLKKAACRAGPREGPPFREPLITSGRGGRGMLSLRVGIETIRDTSGEVAPGAMTLVAAAVLALVTVALWTPGSDTSFCNLHRFSIDLGCFSACLMGESKPFESSTGTNVFWVSVSCSRSDTGPTVTKSPFASGALSTTTVAASVTVSKEGLRLPTLAVGVDCKSFSR